MPIAHVSIAAGRQPEMVMRMAEAVTRAIAESLGAPVETVRVLVTEVPADRWFSGGVSLVQRASAAMKTRDEEA